MELSKTTEDSQDISRSSTANSIEVFERSNKDRIRKKKVKFSPIVTVINVESWKIYNDCLTHDEYEKDKQIGNEKEETNNSKNNENDVKIIIKKKKYKIIKKREQDNVLCSCNIF